MYQFKILFRLEKNFLPREMDRLMISFLKSATQQYSQDFYDALYDKSKSIIKSYVFSYYLPGARFCENKIELNKNEFTLFFSDADQIELLKFFNSFQKMRYRLYPMDGNSMQLVSIYMQKINEIQDNEIVIKFQSPLIVRSHNSMDNTDIYYTHEMAGFAETAKDNVRFFVKKLGIPVSVDDFSIEVIKGKKVVVPVFGRNVDASLGLFKLKGSCQLLNILLLAGAGARRSEGHGKFLVIG